jgi:hypothetical protein
MEILLVARCPSLMPQLFVLGHLKGMLSERVRRERGTMFPVYYVLHLVPDPSSANSSHCLYTDMVQGRPSAATKKSLSYYDGLPGCCL